MAKFSILIATLLIYSVNLRAQSLVEIQNEILHSMYQIRKWDTSVNDLYADDSLNCYNKKLLDYLAIVLVSNPAMLNYDFPALKDKGISMLTSDDQRFRIYFWDVGRFGAQSTNVIMQYKTTRGTAVKVGNDVSMMDESCVSSGSYYSDIYTIKTKSNRTIYLAKGSQKIAMGLYWRGIQAFTIDNDSLNDDIKLFNTSTKALNSIDFTFENSLTNGKPPEIVMSTDKQRIYIPVVLDDGKATNKRLVYVFDGENYVYDKSAR